MKIENLKLKIVFFGSSKYVIPVIESLDKNFDLSLVVTTEKEITDPVVSFCETNSLKYLSVNSLADEDIIRQIEAQKAEIGVVADFGIIIPDEAISLFPKGIINIHPSLLPKYRGPTPVQTAILNGDKRTGITIIKIDSEVDHGPILYQEEAQVGESETSDELLTRLFQKSSIFLPKTISEYVKGTLNLTEQIHSRATLTEHLERKSGFIDPSNPPEKEKLSSMIRAYFPWPGIWTKYFLGGKEVIVKLLPNEKVQVEGKNPVSYKDFMNGYTEATELLQKLHLI